MKKFRNLMLMLALALFFVGAMGMTKSSASETVEPTPGEETTVTPPAQEEPTVTPPAQEEPTVTPPAQEEPTVTPPAQEEAAIEWTVVYEEEIIKVTSDEPVYYQIIKGLDKNEKLKEANWIPAIKGSDGKYDIDFSATPVNKDAFFALTTSKKAASGEKVAIVDATVKSAKITLNYAQENPMKLTDIISTLTVTAIEEKDPVGEEGTLYQLEWKRGANGAWTDGEEFGKYDWDLMKASNTTLYIAIDGVVVAGEEENDEIDFRASKEIKVKIPKTAKAPTVKVDYVKGTIALKNGMQIRKITDGVAGEWVTSPYYNKTKGDAALGAWVQGSAFDFTKNTQKKVAGVTLAELLDLFDIEGLGQNLDLEFEVRNAATVKKFPSAIADLALTTNGGITIKKVTTQETPFELEIDDANKAVIDLNELITDDKIEANEYEYMLVTLEEGKKVDFANKKQKWTKSKTDKITLDTTKKFNVYVEGKTDAVSVEVKDLDYVLVRKAAVATKKVNGVEQVGTFASEYATYYVAFAAAETPGQGEDNEQQEPATEYTITWNVVDGCEVTVKVGEATVAKDGKIAKDAEVTVTVTEGFEVAAATGEGTVTIDSNGKFTMPAANVTLTITAATPEYTITWADVDGCTVSVTVGEDAVAKDGKIAKDAEVTVTVTEGFEVAAATGEGAVTIDSNGKFTMPAANVTLTITAADPGAGE